jgi:hypothetical protein
MFAVNGRKPEEILQIKKQTLYFGFETYCSEIADLWLGASMRGMILLVA